MKKLLISSLVGLLLFIMLPVIVIVAAVGSSNGNNTFPMQWPTMWQNQINSGFGIRVNPLNNEVEFHQALDLYCEFEEPIYAAASGIVVDANSYEWGNTIMIQHAHEIKSRYVHMQELLVSVGDAVTAGDSIATCGSTGWSTGAHLHFAVIDKGHYMNPLQYLMFLSNEQASSENDEKEESN